MIFAKNDSFDVEEVFNKLQGKPNLKCIVLDAKHGFMDKFSQNFDDKAMKMAKKEIFEFLKV